MGGVASFPFAKTSRTVGYHGLYADHNNSRSASHKSCLDVDRPGNWNLSVQGDAAGRLDSPKCELHRKRPDWKCHQRIGRYGSGGQLRPFSPGTCTFTNTLGSAQGGTITITKQVVGTDKVFTFTPSYSGGAFTLLNRRELVVRRSYPSVIHGR